MENSENVTPIELESSENTTFEEKEVELIIAINDLVVDKGVNNNQTLREYFASRVCEETGERLYPDEYLDKHNIFVKTLGVVSSDTKIGALKLDKVIITMQNTKAIGGFL